MNLNLQKKDFACVLNFVNSEYSEKAYIEIINGVEKFCELFNNQFFAILHDKDFLEDGVLKTPHIHLVISQAERTRGTTLINRINEYTGLPKNCISVLPAFDLAQRVQYLIHKNHIEKYQYSVDEIYTNNDDLCIGLLSEPLKKEITAQQLIDLVDSGTTTKNIIQIIGLKNYQTYYRVINDLRRDNRYFEK